MPKIEAAALAGQKRKRDSAKSDRKQTKVKSRRKSTDAEDTESLDPQARILQLEAQITESRRYYNNIAALIQQAQDEDVKDEISILAAVALCRVFCRLLAAGDMVVKGKKMPESEVVIGQWLKERYQEYCRMLLTSEQYLRGESGAKQSTALTLLMRLVKEESGSQKDFNWKTGLPNKIVQVLLTIKDGDAVREEFTERYFKKYDDVRYYTLQAVSSMFDYEYDEDVTECIRTSSLSLLMELDEVPTSKDDLDSFFGERPPSKSQLFSPSSHKQQAQDAWMAVLRSGLTKQERKRVLGEFTHRIAPWFQHVEMLMDFLTDSYNVGGATSLLALSGLYYLMTAKNLDYPSFFPKLYSLLDDTLLHSKHRSRFFRLLDTFMSSTHLPAALVASFIKRLARLALHGPPAGVVVVVPWIYNMFKRHPTCTFMIHREIRDPEIKKELEEEGMDDPFDMDEKDPMLTDAIESSLWEIETLQSHYHPNVATLAKIISEQFTKQSYNLEDFLDHSYTALLDAELNRDLKKAPVVEFEIPKRIFSAEDSEMGPFGQLLGKVIELS